MYCMKPQDCPLQSFLSLFSIRIDFTKLHSMLTLEYLDKFLGIAGSCLFRRACSCGGLLQEGSIDVVHLIPQDTSCVAVF